MAAPLCLALEGDVAEACDNREDREDLVARRRFMLPATIGALPHQEVHRLLLLLLQLLLLRWEANVAAGNTAAAGETEEEPEEPEDGRQLEPVP